MLSLMDPVELDDLVVFRDDEDPRKFYLLPDQPQVSVDEQGEPEFLFVKFIKDVDTLGEEEEASGGYIQLRTTLAIAPARRQRVVEALTARLEQEKAAGKQPFGVAITSTTPLLAAPLWTDGRATLATFQVSDTGLVRHATNEAKVDLSGDLGASFNLHLDHDGSEIFWSAFKNYGQQVPILISYELKYKARVSAKMTIDAKRSVLHRQLWQQARPFKLLIDRFPRYVPVQAPAGPLTPLLLSNLRAQFHLPIAAMIEPPQVRTAVQETITTNAINVRIETDQAGGGEEEAKVREMMFKVATEVLSDQLIPTLFGAGTNTLPGAGSENDSRPTKQLIEVKEEPADGTATFQLTLDHQTSIERNVNPNGPIQLAIATPEKLARCFSEVRAGDGFFKELRVAVSTAGVNFERDGIDRIHVWLLYDETDEPHASRPRVRREADGVLTSEKETLKIPPIDLARAANGAHKRSYRYRTKVFYKQGPPSPPEDDNWAVASDRMLLITAASVGAIRVDLVLTAPSVVESARVELSHAASGRTFEAALELTPSANRRTWFQFTGATTTSGTPAPPRYSYRVIYRVAGGQIVTRWTDATTELLEIPGPFARTLTFTVRPGGSFDGVASIAGDIVYDDRAHGYHFAKSFQLVKLTDAFVFDVPVLEGGPETARWTARVKMNDGSHEDLPAQEGPSGTIWLGQGGGRNLAVNVVTDLIDFDTDVQLALVELRYADPANGMDERKTFTFSKTAKAGQTWKLSIRPDGPKTYDVDIRYIAYDRTKNSQVTQRGIGVDTLLLDRTGG